MKTTSKWGGLGASFFCIVCFVEGTACAITPGNLPNWFAIVTGSCFLLATISGVVCLATALIDHFQRRQPGHRPADSGKEQASVA